MEKNLTPLLVVAAALERGDGRFLFHRRPSHHENGNLWEFPGGKVETGEGLAMALAREIEEECGLFVAPSDFAPVGFATGEREKGELVLLLFHAILGEGDPVSREGGVWEWHTLESAAALDLGPLDRRLHADLVRWTRRNRT